jgi:hypothetical protein
MIKGESLSINAQNQSISLSRTMSSAELRVVCATARKRRDPLSSCVFSPHLDKISHERPKEY